MFDWNCRIFWRINRQIIRVTQTPWKSLCLLSRKKKKIHTSSEWYFTWKTYQAMGKFPILALRALPLQESRGCVKPSPCDNDQHPGLQAGQPCPPSYLQSPKILHSPPSLTGQPGCFSCTSGLSLGNSGLFNYLASDWSDFSLFSWQPSRIHPSFSFSQRRFWAATAEDQPKAAHWTAVMRGEASTRAVDLWELTLTEHYQSLRKRRRK